MFARVRSSAFVLGFLFLTILSTATARAELNAYRGTRVYPGLGTPHGNGGWWGPFYRTTYRHAGSFGYGYLQSGYALPVASGCGSYGCSPRACYGGNCWTGPVLVNFDTPPLKPEPPPANLRNENLPDGDSKSELPAQPKDVEPPAKEGSPAKEEARRSFSTDELIERLANVASPKTARQLRQMGTARPVAIQSAAPQSVAVANTRSASK